MKRQRFKSAPTDGGTFVVWDDELRTVVQWDGKPIEFTDRANADRMAHVMEVRS